MDLSRSFQRFAEIGLRHFNPATSAQSAPVATGSLQVYDRFVSDREFGIKKRLFLVPGQYEPEWAQLVKLEGLPGVWLQEGMNHDAAGSIYASVVVLHEAPFELSLRRRTGGTARASGVGKVLPSLVEYAKTWGDFSRYSGNESSRFDNVDYTVCSWYLPAGTDVDLDTIIVSGTKKYIVKEVTTFLQLTLVRAQEQENP